VDVIADAGLLRAGVLNQELRDPLEAGCRLLECRETD